MTSQPASTAQADNETVTSNRSLSDNQPAQQPEIKHAFKRTETASQQARKNQPEDS